MGFGGIRAADRRVGGFDGMEVIVNHIVHIFNHAVQLSTCCVPTMQG